MYSIKMETQDVVFNRQKIQLIDECTPKICTLSRNEGFKRYATHKWLGTTGLIDEIKYFTQGTI